MENFHCLVDAIALALLLPVVSLQGKVIYAHTHSTHITVKVSTKDYCEPQ